MTRVEKAAQLFQSGYNCAQSVAGAYADRMGMTLEQVTRLASSFGGGMGGKREICGAVSVMILVLGALEGYADPNDRAAKKAHYDRVSRLMDRFRAEHGSVVCRDLLGLTPGVPKRQGGCLDMVTSAVALLEQELQEET